MNIQQIFRKAITQYGHETRGLEFLPENRYNKGIFPTTGQYDWFSGQSLYCLIRYCKPRRILEISTASGYATLFMAMALKKNGWGKVDTHELNPRAARAAMQLFKNNQVERFINCHLGDARKTSQDAAADYTIYFLDSLHTEGFARWFIENHVMRSDRIDALFHMHDILPLHARVRRYNTPPLEISEFNPQTKKDTFGGIKKAFPFLFHPEPETEDVIPIHVYPAENKDSLETFNGNFTTEAIWGNKLAALMNPDDHVFLHDIANDYPELSPRKYDHSVIARTDSNNNPMEWNESWWCTVSALKKAYTQISAKHPSDENHGDKE